MITVKQLIDQLKMGLEEKFISEGDVVILVSTGMSPAAVDSVSFPRIMINTKNLIERELERDNRQYMAFITREHLDEGMHELVVDTTKPFQVTVEILKNEK